MIYRLVNNDHHGNNCALFKCRKNKKTFYIKVSFSKAANKIIENEKKGYDWFCSMTNRKDKTRLIKSPFYEIYIPEFKGKIFPYDYQYPKNIEKIELIIDFYKQYWPVNGDIGIQGDLAFSNLVFNSNEEVNIIDWEHFHIADSGYYGFDIIHLLFLTLYKRIDRLKSSEKSFLRECYKNLCHKVSSDNKILAKPFINSKKYLNEFSNNFSLNIPIKNKFTLASFPSEKLEKLDLIIS